MTHYTKLPDRLDRPMIYLSREQMEVLEDDDKLRGVRDIIYGLELREEGGLPGWVPAEVIRQVGTSNSHLLKVSLRRW